MSATKEHYHDQIEAGQRGKEIPILFSTPMVQAILDGRKGMTRRMTGLGKVNEDPDAIEFLRFQEYKDGSYRAIFQHKLADEPGSVKCPYGKVGDLLWVREKFAKTIGVFEPEITYSYFADSFHCSFYPEDDMKGETSCQWHDEDLAKEVKWKPSIHMPKAAARIWLQVEEIRVERLNDISEEDMISEGVLIPVSERNTPLFVLGTANSAFGFLPDGCLSDGATPPTKKQILFAFWTELWCKINGRESWDSNPWVWVVKFKTLSTTGWPEIETSKPSAKADGKG